jgi:hypothetical protein
MKSVSFNPLVEVISVPSEDTTNKLLVQQRQNRSYAQIDLEVKRRKREAFQTTKENLKSTHHNLKLVQEVLYTMSPKNPDYVYFKNLKNEILFDLRLLSLKMTHYKKKV